MKDNIVGTVATILALIWIPACYFIKQYDRAQRQKRDEIRASRRGNGSGLSRSFGNRDHRNPGQRKHVIIRAGQGDPVESEPFNPGRNGVNGRGDVPDTDDGFKSRPAVQLIPQQPFGPPQPDSVIFGRHRSNSSGSGTESVNLLTRPVPASIVAAPMAEPEEVNTPTSKTSARSVML